MNAIWLEKSHEPQGWVRRMEVARTGIGFHQVQEGQRKKSPCSPEKGPALNFPIPAHFSSNGPNTVSRKGALLATSIRSSFQVEFPKDALLAISSTTE